MPNTPRCFACGRLILPGAPKIEVEMTRADGSSLSLVFGSPECHAEGAQEMARAHAHEIEAQIPAAESPMGWRNGVLRIVLDADEARAAAKARREAVAAGGDRDCVTGPAVR
jgi:hypothetical protein